MDLGTSNLLCTVKIEWRNAQTVIIRELSCRKAVLRIYRNCTRELCLEVTGDKIPPIDLKYANLKVHNKFLSEGKASICFLSIRCTLFISNAPPNNLQLFLRTSFIKLTEDKEKAPLSRTALQTLLLSKHGTKEEISPVTLKELNKAKAKALTDSNKTPTISPNRKRKFRDRSEISVAKKINMNHHEISLSAEQQQILQACLNGQNIFYTGGAGTGKSYLLRKIIHSFPPEVTVATASTGVAACHIGGITLHSFAGIGSGDAALEQCYKLASRPGHSVVWKRCKHLIIDEISMVEASYFEKLEAVARYVRQNDKPFGGIQLILCGDFFQLPPVNRKETKRFCFETAAWNRCVQKSLELSKVHRQSDPEFIKILNNIRIGNVTEEIVSRLSQTLTQNIEHSGILPTHLCAFVNEAKNINERKLSELEGSSQVYIARDSNEDTNHALNQLIVPERLVLKIGAQVMLLKTLSISKGLVNGARGIVISFYENRYPVVKFKNGISQVIMEQKWSLKLSSGKVAVRSQIPLQLAWAFSIHKSQGLTLDCVEISLDSIFEDGQAYVALSRAKSLDGLRVLSIKKEVIRANPRVLRFYYRLKEKLKYDNTTMTSLRRI